MDIKNEDRELSETEIKFITYDDLRRILDDVEEFRESCLQWRYHMSGRGTYIKDYERHEAIENYAVEIADNALRDIDELKKMIWSICEDLASGKLEVKGNFWDCADWPVYK